MEHREYYMPYLRAFSCAMLGVGASVFSEIKHDEKAYAATALGVLAGKQGTFSTLEEFCNEMEDLFRISPKTDAAT